MRVRFSPEERAEGEGEFVFPNPSERWKAMVYNALYWNRKGYRVKIVTESEHSKYHVTRLMLLADVRMGEGVTLLEGVTRKPECEGRCVYFLSSLLRGEEERGEKRRWVVEFVPEDVRGVRSVVFSEEERERLGGVLYPGDRDFEVFRGTVFAARAYPSVGRIVEKGEGTLLVKEGYYPYPLINYVRRMGVDAGYYPYSPFRLLRGRERVVRSTPAPLTLEEIHYATAMKRRTVVKWVKRLLGSELFPVVTYRGLSFVNREGREMYPFGEELGALFEKREMLEDYFLRFFL